MLILFQTSGDFSGNSLLRFSARETTANFLEGVAPNAKNSIIAICRQALRANDLQIFVRMSMMAATLKTARRDADKQ